jgi:hypothetical protein
MYSLTMYVHPKSILGLQPTPLTPEPANQHRQLLKLKSIQENNRINILNQISIAHQTALLLGTL